MQPLDTGPAEQLAAAQPTPPLPPGRTRRAVAVEAVGAWVVTVAGIGTLVALGRLSSFLLENTLALAALLFVYLATWLLRREGSHPEDYGITARGLRRQLLAAAAVGLVVFPLFAVGYHVFQTQWRERELSVSSQAVLRWPRWLEERPATLPTDQPWAVWTERGSLTVLWQEADPQRKVSARLTLDEPAGDAWLADVRNGRLFLRSAPPGGMLRRPDPQTIEVMSTRPGGVRIQTGRATWVRIEIERAGRTPESSEVAAGEWALPPSDDPPLEASRSWWWLLELLLIHLVLVGIPEEVFYRGYLQTRLRVLLPGGWRLLGAPVGPALFLTSILFALSHFIIELDPGRLSVFFPSLLFGWVRERTGTVAAAAVVHGLSNVLIDLLSRMYV